MTEKLEKCFARLQNLDIKPTQANMETLLQTLYDLRDIYKELVKLEKEEGAEDEGAQTDTE
jgi:hypothetical protein